MPTKPQPKPQQYGAMFRTMQRAWCRTIGRSKTTIAVTSLALVILGVLAVGIFTMIPVGPTEAKASVQLYKNPQCSCCETYASYLRRHGYAVATTPTHNLSLIRRRHGVPDNLVGCHTMIVGGYVVEGHVPVDLIDKLLTERPNIKGISLPGMPEGSPGMTGRKAEPFTIYEISDGEPKVYAVK